MNGNYKVKHKNGWTGVVEKIYSIEDQCIVAIKRGNELVEFAYPQAFEVSEGGAVFVEADAEFMEKIRNFAMEQRENQEVIRRKKEEETAERERVMAERKAEKEKITAERKGEMERLSKEKRLWEQQKKETVFCRTLYDGNRIDSIGTYIPRDYRTFVSDIQALEFTDQLLDFKYHRKDNIAYFAKMLEQWLVQRTEKADVKKNILFLAAPSSDAFNPYCPTALAIQQACTDIANSRNEEAALLPGYNVVDGTERLKRSVSVIKSSQAAAMGLARPTSITHFNSISFDASGLEDLKEEGMTVIIVDDITTRGETLTGCRMRVENSGIASEDIRCMAFGRTQKCVAY